MSGAVAVSCDQSGDFPLLPGRTALLMIDMQRDFLEPTGVSAREGAPLDAIRRVIAPAIALLAAARTCRMMVIHTREGHRANLADLTESKRWRSVAAGVPIGSIGEDGRYLVRGERTHDFSPGFEPLPDETVIDKPGFGAFYATDLDHILRVGGIDTLIFAGVTAQCCVQSTLREAIDRGFRCLTLKDCIGAFNPEFVDMTIRIIKEEGNLFGWVSDSDRLIAALAGWPMSGERDAANVSPPKAST